MALRWRLHDALQARARGADVPRVAALLVAQPGMRVLDVGGGTGLFAERAAPGCDVTVVEPHAGKRAYGAARRPSLRFMGGNAERLDFPSERFDRAMMLLALHHVRDQAAALRELRRVLRPGGVLVLQELATSTHTGHCVHWFENRLLRQGCVFHEPDALAALVARAGFVDVALHSAAKGYLLRAGRA